MEPPQRSSTGDGSARQPFSCPECERTVGHANVLTGDFAFDDVTPKTTRPDGSPEFQKTGMEGGPQKAIALRCDFCGEEFMLGVETGDAD
jgi:hypothetical protein